MDIGASTGGFTDCMLQNGATKVYSVDVGYGQFAWKLRQDPRVVCMEKTNIRYVTPEDIDDVLDFASVDVSFISLTKNFRACKKSLKRRRNRWFVLSNHSLRQDVKKSAKKGVVRDKAVHLEVVERIVSFALEQDFPCCTFPILRSKDRREILSIWCTSRKAKTATKEESVDPGGRIVRSSTCRS